MNIRYITSICLLSGAIAATAQDLTTEITVDRTVVTELPAAAPLASVFPTSPDGSGNVFTLKPTQYMQWADFLAAPLNLNAPLYTGFNPGPDYRGYAMAGYFPAYNAKAAVGYSAIKNRDSHLGVSLGFDGYSYKYDGNKTLNNTFRAKIDGFHRFSTGTVFTARADYLYSSLENFGEDRVADSFRFRAGLFNREKFRAGAEFDYFGINDAFPVGNTYAGKPRDLRFSVNGAYILALGEKTDLDFGVKADVLNRNGVQDMFTAAGDYSFTAYLVELNPALRYDSDNFKAHVGVRLSLAHNTTCGKYAIVPDVTLVWTPSGIVDLYARADGGHEMRGFRWQYEVSPFSLGPNAECMSKSTVNGRAGINLRPLSGLQVGLFAGYSSWRNAPVFMRYNTWESIGNFTRLPSNYNYIDLKGANYGFEASYEVAEWGRVAVDGTVYSEGDPTAADRAKFVGNARLSVRPIDKLTIDVDYRLRTSRRYIAINYIHNNGDDTYIYEHDGDMPLGDVSDFGIRGTYKITPRFSAFLRLDNVFGKRYQILPDLYSRTIHGLLGVSYVF